MAEKKDMSLTTSRITSMGSLTSSRDPKGQSDGS